MRRRGLYSTRCAVGYTAPSVLWVIQHPVCRGLTKQLALQRVYSWSKKSCPFLSKKNWTRRCGQSAVEYIGLNIMYNNVSVKSTTLDKVFLIILQRAKSGHRTLNTIHI